MIRSVNPVITSRIDTTVTNHVYAQSLLRPSTFDYMVHTTYYIKNVLRPAIPASEGIEAQEEVWEYQKIDENVTMYTIAEIDQMFEMVKPYVSGLYYTAMVERGIELLLKDFLDNNERFGIPVNSNGWEIIDDE